MRSLKNAQINLCTWSFSLLKDCFCLNWSCLFAIFLLDFFCTVGVRTSNTDEADSMVFRCSIYLFILLTNTKLLNYYISVLLNFYISNEFNKIHCKIYLKLLINIPESRVLGHVFLSFSPKLIESHKRIRLVMNFS